MLIHCLCAFILLVVCGPNVLAAAKPTSATSTFSDDRTCPFRTVNYLTHSLPQQCLVSPRSSRVDGSGTTIAVASSATPTTIARSSSLPRNSKISISTSTSSPPSVISLPARDISLTESILTTTHLVTTLTATPVTSALPVPALLEGPDEDSPLANDKFLSFEDWKKQNLIKAGQYENLGTDTRGEQRQSRERSTNTHDTLDSLGDDVEIDLDFSGLVPGGPDRLSDLRGQDAVTTSSSDRVVDSGSRSAGHPRSKDAGTTCKERFNYASFDCAANVLKSNPEAKSSLAVLKENKDSYMLNKCSADNKFIILELCNDILIDTVVLANFEFFSSSFRSFRVSVSDRYPVKVEKWKTLGVFEARNTREVQAFLVENPVIWARYVRVEFLTHYGYEFYCPLSLVRIHGTTMYEEYKIDQDRTTDDDDHEAEGTSALESAEDKLVPEAVDESLMLERYKQATVKQSSTHDSSNTTSATRPDPTGGQANETDIDPHGSMSPNAMYVIHNLLLSTIHEACLVDTQPPSNISSENDSHTQASDTTTKSSIKPDNSNLKQDTRSASLSQDRSSSAASLGSKNRSTGHSSSGFPESNTAKSTFGSSEPKRNVSTKVDQSKPNSATKQSPRSNASKQSPSGTQSQPAVPTMQESFFKSVQKRLQMLETNSSLSLQYIEEQSRALRDAFHKVEQRQLSKTTTFLEQLNQTVLNELREFRQQYDQLWQSTVIELELQRERHEHENQAMHARLGVLADELVFQRRVSILQMCLILICLGLVLFSKGALQNNLELPLIQSVLLRSPSSRRATTPDDSIITTPPMKRTRSAHEIGGKQGILKNHRRGLSEESTIEPLSGSEIYSPPTPVSFDGYSDAEHMNADSKADDPEFDPIKIERPSTSPPMLPSVSDPSTPRSVMQLDSSSIDSRIFTPVSSTAESGVPEVKIEYPTPPERHLTWDLPD